MRHLVLVAALAAVALGSPHRAAGQKQAEEKGFYGTWVLTALGVNGQEIKFPDGVAGAYTFSQDGTFVLAAPGFPDRKGTFRVNPAKSPKEIDLTLLPKEGELSEVMQAIYKIEGGGLVVAYPPKAGGKRPTSFDSKEVETMTLKRQKP